jgi:hypothetical protein
MLVGGVALVCSLYGMLLTYVATGDPERLLNGATVGFYLAFSALGASTGASSTADFGGFDEAGVGFGSEFLPLVLALVPLAATWLVLRFGCRRLPMARERVLAYVAKVVVSFSAVVGILASVVSFGENGLDTTDATEGFLSEVSAGSAMFYGLLLSGVAGVAFLLGQGVLGTVIPWVQRSASAVRTLADGVIAYAGLAAVAGLLALGAALVTADSGTDRALLLLGLPVVGANLAAAATTVGMGGSVALADEGGLIDGGLDTHISLLRWGFPPESDAGAAPVPFFLMLVLAPVAVAWLTTRRLNGEQPQTEQEVLKVGFLAALGFAVTAWLAGLLGRMELVGFATDWDRSFGALVARPSASAALGLGLVWGLLGGLGAAFLWARRSGTPWQPAPDDAWATAPDGPAAPPTDPPTDRWASPSVRTDSACTACGMSADPTDAWCRACGQRLGPGT